MIAPVVTSDGSYTLLHPGYGETYHSVTGALTESHHVFLEASGVTSRLLARQPTRVLEIGFGLGLNTLLTADLAVASGCCLDYHSFENDLLPAEQLRQLHYDSLLQHPQIHHQLLAAMTGTDSMHTDSMHTGSRHTGSRHNGSRHNGSRHNGSRQSSSRPVACKRIAVPLPPIAAADLSHPSEKAHVGPEAAPAASPDVQTRPVNHAQPSTLPSNNDRPNQLVLHLADATLSNLPSLSFDAIYLDAFSPDCNAECWSMEFFEKLAAVMSVQGKLTTYSAKGQVRRNLLAAGLNVKKHPGAPGKREMLIASHE